MSIGMMSPAKCPKCGYVNTLAYAELDTQLENDTEIEVPCFNCEYKFALASQDKERLRNQRHVQGTLSR